MSATKIAYRKKESGISLSDLETRVTKLEILNLSDSESKNWDREQIPNLIEEILALKAANKKLEDRLSQLEEKNLAKFDIRKKSCENVDKCIILFEYIGEYDEYQIPFYINCTINIKILDSILENFMKNSTDFPKISWKTSESGQYAFTKMEKLIQLFPKIADRYLTSVPSLSRAVDAYFDKFYFGVPETDAELKKLVEFLFSRLKKFLTE